MTVIVPEINTRTSVEKIVSPPATGIITNGFEEWKDDETTDNDTRTNLPQCLDEETSFTATIKNTSDSISMVFSKNKTPHKKETIMANGSVFPGSGMKVVSRGRRRSVDKQYKPTQPTNSGGSRGSTRRSGRYQNYDNNSSNGNSGADGNGEDNDDSDDDDDDEYIDEDDDDEEEDEEEEEEEEDDEDNKNEEEDEDETANGRDKSANNMDGINEKLLSSLSIKGSDETSVVMMNSGTSEMTLAPAPSGTPVNLEGVICHETMGGVLVVNIKWRNKIYCGSLMDCTRHSWARPRFQSSDSSNQGKTRLGKNNGRGKGKGRGKRLRSESVSRDNANNHTVSPLKQKLRGRKKTISGSSTDKRTGFRSSKRKAKNNDDDSDDSIRPGKRSCTMKGAPSPQPSPTLIECPEPGCEKKYKHINGLRYHQAHAHLESKTQDDDANSDDRSSTTPSPSDEFKEPDPRITTKGRASSRNRSESPSITQDKNNSNIDKDVSNTEADKKPKNEPIKDEDEPANLWDAEPDKKPDDNEVVDKKQKEEPKKEEHVDDKSNTLDVNESPEENGEVCYVKTQEHSTEGEFVEVADKSTDTRMMNSTGESKQVTSYPCDKHTGISLEMVLPASEVPEVADTQEVCVTVLDSGCISNTKYEETGSVNIDDVISSQSEAMDDSVKLEKVESQEFGKESEVDSVFDSKDDRRQIMLTTGSINQLGIEVEDISENEEDIDPGQDTEFNSREEMEKAVENLQTGSFVASMSTENNLQMLSSLKDPSLIFGLTNRDKTSEDGTTTTDTSRTEDIFSILPRNRQLNDEDADQITENSIDSELEVATQPLLGVAGENRDDITISVDSVPSLSAKSEHETLETSFSNSPSSMSVENLVSRSISASKLQPPLTNTDTPSSRFKYFTCRSYGDEAYSRTASNITNTNTVTTLALIRDPDLIKQDNLSEKNANSNELQAATMNTHKDPVASVVENVGPSYTGSAGFDRDCTTSSIHTRGPKEEHKGESFTGDIIRSKSYGSTGNISVDKKRRNESGSKVSFSSPKSTITTTATTYNLQQYSPKSEEFNSIKKDSSDDVGWVNLEKESSNQSNEGDVSSALSEGTGDEGKKDGDREKSSSRMFLRQPPTLIPKHSRPTPPILPVGVAHPYQYSTVATSAAVTTGLSVTSPGRQELCRPEPVCHNTPSKPDTELESKPPILKKVVAEKAHPIPVGEVGPVAVKRPAIHAGLPTVIPAGAPVIKSQGSLHTSIRQGLKPPGQEERASTPGGLSSRLSGSPRPLPSSPRPLSTSPRLPLSKAKISETKSSTANESLSSSSSSEKLIKDTDTDVVIVKEEHEPVSDKGSSIDAEKIKDRKRSPYQSSKVQLTPENYMYQLQQRQMYQAGMELAYMPPFASPWHLSMSPEQIKLVQQHHYRMRAEEETREISKNPKEDPNKLRMEKRDSSSSIERRTASEGRTPEQVVRSTPPRPERRLITGISSSSEVPRSSASDMLNRGVPRLTQVEEPPEKKMRAEYSKSDDAERELQKLRHKRQEEYLSKQSMQHKFTMFKQLESGGGAAKTHSIPPLTTTNKDRLGEREDDYPKSKYAQRSPHGESLQPRTQETSKVTTSNEANSSDTSKSRDTNRDSSRDTHLKPSSKHTWTSSSSSRHSDTPPSERTSSSFRPTQFQAYLQHNQMIEPMNYDPATGNPVLIQTSMGLMPHQLPMELGGAMNPSSSSVITSSISTPTSVPSRLKERERLSPYRGTNIDQSPLSSSHSHSRSPRSRSPSRDASPISSSHSKSTYSRNNDRPRSPLSHARSSYKTPDKTPSSSPSVVSSSHLHRSGGERMSSTATVGSRSTHRNSERSSSPSIHSHKESYRVPTSSPSRSSVFNRGERSASPPRSKAHNEYRLKQRSESSGNTVSRDNLSKAKTAHEDPAYRGQERHESEAAKQLRPGIISNNLAVRRGDVTPSMLMVTPAQEEELIRRHHYMLYMQQQEQAAAFAMMSSNQHNASRSGPYYAKRQ